MFYLLLILVIAFAFYLNYKLNGDLMEARRAISTLTNNLLREEQENFTLSSINTELVQKIEAFRMIAEGKVLRKSAIFGKRSAKSKLKRSRSGSK